MKLINLLATSASLASAVTALTVPGLTVPARATEDATKDIATQCNVLIATNSAPKWCYDFQKTGAVCIHGPFKTPNGLVWHASGQDSDGNCRPFVPLKNPSDGTMMTELPSNMNEEIEKKCLQVEQKDDLMCQQFLTTGKGTFNVVLIDEGFPGGLGFTFAADQHVPHALVEGSLPWCVKTVEEGKHQKKIDECMEKYGVNDSERDSTEQGSLNIQGMSKEQCQDGLREGKMEWTLARACVNTYFP